MKKLLFLSLFLFSQIVLSEPSKSDKDLYELQDKCRQTTDQEFKKEWGSNVSNTKDGQIIANYTNHYNKKMNRCFYLVTSNQFVTKNKDGTNPFIIKTLLDVQENKVYGDFSSDRKTMFSCAVGKSYCSSEKEWDSLVLPFMNE